MKSYFNVINLWISIFYMIILDTKFNQYISSTYELMTEIKLTKILSFVE